MHDFQWYIRNSQEIACGCTATLLRPYAFSQLCLHLYGMKILPFILITEYFIRAKSEFGEIREKCQRPLLWKIHFKGLSGALIYWKLRTGLSVGVSQGTSAYLPYMYSQIYLLSWNPSYICSERGTLYFDLILSISGSWTLPAYVAPMKWGTRAKWGSKRQACEAF